MPIFKICMKQAKHRGEQDSWLSESRGVALYERLFGESLLYFYRNYHRFSDWQAVVIYPSRSFEQSEVYPHRGLLSSEQVHRVYLDELGDIQSLTTPVAATVLTIVDEKAAPDAARSLLERTKQESFTLQARKDLIDIVTSIMVYKFANLSRLEIRAMLGLDLTQEPCAIQEAKAEGREVEAIALITRFLTRRLKQELPEETRSQLSALQLPVLEDLSEALLDFENLADLERWLSAHQ